MTTSRRTERVRDAIYVTRPPPAPWPQGPSSMASPQTSYELCSWSCLLLLLERHSHQSLWGVFELRVWQKNVRNTQVLRQTNIQGKPCDVIRQKMHQNFKTHKSKVFTAGSKTTERNLKQCTSNLHWAIFPEKNISSFQIPVKKEKKEH